MARPLRKVPVHYIRPNHTSWTPPCLVSFDTETRSEYIGDDEVHTLRLWSARLTDRRVRKGRQPEELAERGKTGDELADVIHSWCRRRKTVWAYAHNLGFDLCTSMLTEQLIEREYEVTEFAVSSGSPFVRMRNGDHSLTLSDSWSWFNCGLDKVAEAMGMTKPPLPKDTDTEQEFMDRCEADTNILHEAMFTLMEWWEENDLGHWNITGSASGWNALRHRPTAERILIRPDDAECDADRAAIYGGRRQVWISGNTRYGHYTEIDIEKAYTAVCREMPLPIGRNAPFDTLPADHSWVDCRRWGIVAECTIRTDTARVPVRHSGGVWYPVGAFRTILAGPDIRECRALGILESIGPGWAHKLGHPLRPWAMWCLDSMREDNTAVPDVAKLVHKMWARSAVGKWAQRGFEVIEIGPSPQLGWHYEEAWHHGKNVPAGIVDFGGTRYQVAAVNQSDNAYPAILAFVESYVRVAIGRAIRASGESHMVACDTDGYICDLVAAHDLGVVNAAIAPLRARPKRHFKRIRVLGPQHLELDQLKRRSGIPGSAQPAGNGKLEAWTWPKLAWQLQNGRAGAYVRPRQEYTLAASYASGWVLTDGSVVSIEMRINSDGANEIVPFDQTRYAAAGHALADGQNRLLERYRDSGHNDAAHTDH